MHTLEDMQCLNNRCSKAKYRAPKYILADCFGSSNLLHKLEHSGNTLCMHLLSAIMEYVIRSVCNGFEA